MVYFDVAPTDAGRTALRRLAGDLLVALQGEDVRISHIGEGSFRAVTHLGITAGDVDHAVEALRAACA
jgi:threonine aldolase